MPAHGRGAAAAASAWDDCLAEVLADMGLSTADMLRRGERAAWPTTAAWVEHLLDFSARCREYFRHHPYTKEDRDGTSAAR